MKCDLCGKNFKENDIIVAKFKDECTANNYLCSTCLKAKIGKLFKFTTINECFEKLTAVDSLGKEHSFIIEEHKYLIETLWVVYELDNDEGKIKKHEISFKTGKQEQAFSELLDKLMLELNSQVKNQGSDQSKDTKQISNKKLQGVILEDEIQTKRTPKFIIDGKEYSLIELGQMLINYEGWSFKIEVAASPEELRKIV